MFGDYDNGVRVAGRAAAILATIIIEATTATPPRDVCPGGPPDACCAPWNISTYISGPANEIAIPMWMACDLNCDNYIDLRDVQIWQNDWDGCWCDGSPECAP